MTGMFQRIVKIDMNPLTPPPMATDWKYIIRPTINPEIRAHTQSGSSATAEMVTPIAAKIPANRM